MPWLRLLVAFLAAVVPPTVGMLVIVVGAWPASTADRAISAGIVLVLSLGWAIVLAAVYGRLLRSESSLLLEVAEQGGQVSPGHDDQPRDGRSRLVAALADREQQLAVLAREIAESPITDDPSSVVHHVVRAAHAVTRDDTWSLAIMGSDEDLLDPGVFDGSDAEAEQLSELQRWASVSGPAGAGEDAIRSIDGPWGRFMVVAAGSQRVRAILMAPWEGRAEPSRADAALLRLVGRHAATTLEHAVLYATVRTQSDEIRRLAAVQADFLRGVSHDLQTPLTSIRALASEVASSPALSPDARADLHMIDHQADRLRRMVAQLLTVSRLEAGVVETRQEVFAIRPVVERTWAALRAFDREIDLSVGRPAMLGVGDPDRFEQVMWAVLENAVRYSPGASAVHVSIEPHVESSEIAVAVRDEGTGMDRDTIERAFDQFYRAPSARALAPDGSGIGLYAARGLMVAMGGTITIESRLGSGSVVTITLPAERADITEDDRTT